MRTLELHPSVYNEIDNAQKWYEEKASHLGEEFFLEIESAISKIKQTPETWPVYLSIKGIHRILAHRFPFGIYYRFNEKSILVIAVGHLHRVPNYWVNRL